WHARRHGLVRGDPAAQPRGLRHRRRRARHRPGWQNLIESGHRGRAFKGSEHCMAKAFAREIWIVGAKRTAFGTFGGALKDLTATDLAVEASKAALKESGVDPSKVEQVIFGNV